MSRHPRPYQLAMHEATREAFRHGKKRVVMEAATGLGKTVVFALMAKMAVEKKGRVLIIVNRDVLVTQALNELAANGVHAQREQAQDRASILADVVVGSIQSMQGKWLKKWAPNYFRLVILDECFPENTPIETPSGPRPIGDLLVGDVVLAYNHIAARVQEKRVTRVFIRQTDRLLAMRLSDGRVIHCTPEHPFYCDGEYIPARLLTRGSTVRSMAHEQAAMHAAGAQGNLYELSARNSIREPLRERRDAISWIRGVASRVGLLLSNLSRYALRAFAFRSHDEQESYDETGDSREVENFTSRDGMEANRSGREREAASASPDSYGCDAGMGNRSGGSDRATKGFGLSPALQAGHRESGSESGRGNRRELPLLTGEEGARPEERRTLETLRVERTTVLERSRDWRFDDVCPRGLVRNIEVEDCNNYFASGILVHNCHGSAAKTFKNVLDHFEGAYHCGVTATAERHDKRALWNKYEDIVFRMPLATWLDKETGELIPGGQDEGWLVPFDFHEMECPVTLDEKLMHHAILKEDEEVFDSKKYLPRLAREAADRSRGAKGLFFLPNCRVSNGFAELMREHGINAQHIDSSYMKPSETNRLLHWFAETKEGVLCNADYLSVGYNQPDINLIGLFRPIASTPMYKQRLGRGTRAIAPVDNFTTAAERRQAISDSPKPNCKVLNVFWENGSHDLAAPSCLITDDKEEQKALSKSGKSMIPQNLDEMRGNLKAMRDVEEEKRKFAERVANSQQKKLRKFDGPYINDILSRNTGGENASDKQINFLLYLGCKNARALGLSKGQASQVINRYKKHKERAQV